MHEGTQTVDDGRASSDAFRITEVSVAPVGEGGAACAQSIEAGAACSIGIEVGASCATAPEFQSQPEARRV